MQNKTQGKPIILMVDDKPMNLLSLSAAIQNDEFHIVQAGSGNEALSLVLDHDFALILLDVQMPGMDGFETAELIRSNAKTRHIPIIFISAVSQEETHLFKGYDKGAVDYLFKPVNIFILKSKIHIFMELYKQNILLKDLSVKDGLTGLYNHRHMNEVMESEFNRAIRYKTDLSCLLMDIDYFKSVNDTLGHPFGDFVLKGFADHLIEHVRDSDFVFRYGGEEFLVLLPQTDLNGAVAMAEKFRKAMEQVVFKQLEHQTSLTVSIGVASIYTHHPSGYSELIAFADQALFAAKAEGRNRSHVYDENDHDPLYKKLPRDQRVHYIKDNIVAVLTKTKKSSVASLELLVRDLGNSRMEKRSLMLREYITMLGYHMNLPPQVVETFKLAATIHDCFQSMIGCADDGIQPEEDRKQIPFLMAELTEKFDFFADEREVLLAHHEHYDGSGYPLGLEKDQIPMGARIFSIAEAFVTLCMASESNSESMDSAVITLAEKAGSIFDPQLVSLFLKALKACDPNKISDQTFDEAKKTMAIHLKGKSGKRGGKA
ncbi:MAG: diguanylate cyclase [Desulfobacteraceae bacterium]|jgi:diguanylate cyclase (GGDEF)-like protein